MGSLRELSIIPQGDHANWCWASVTAGICQFLDKRSYTLEEIVVMCLGDNSCVDKPTPLTCDIGWPLENALASVKHLAQQLHGTMTFQELQRQIDVMQMPVAIEITFPSAFGDVVHGCLIKGCLVVDGSEEIILLDPSKAATGESQLSVADLLSGVVLGAPWTDTYTTK